MLWRRRAMQGVTSGGAQGGGSGGQGHAALTRRRLTEEPAGLGADLVLPQAVRLEGVESAPYSPL